MTEQWAIAIVGFAIGMLGWAVHGISTQIKNLNDKIDGILETMVKQSTCNSAMGMHCTRITDLEKQVQKNTTAIRIIEAKQK